MQIETPTQIQQRLHKEQRLLMLYAEAVRETGVCDFPALVTHAQTSYHQRQSLSAKSEALVAAEAETLLPSETCEPAPEAQESASPEPAPTSPEAADSVLKVLHSFDWVDPSLARVEAPVVETASSLSVATVPEQGVAESIDMPQTPETGLSEDQVYQQQATLLSLFIQETKRTGECDYPELQAYLATQHPAIAPKLSTPWRCLTLQSCEQHLQKLHTQLATAQQCSPLAGFDHHDHHLDGLDQRLKTLLDQVSLCLPTHSSEFYPQALRPIQRLHHRLAQRLRRLHLRRLLWRQRLSTRQHLAEWEALVAQADLLLGLCRQLLSPEPTSHG